MVCSLGWHTAGTHEQEMVDREQAVTPWCSDILEPPAWGAEPHTETVMWPFLDWAAGWEKEMASGAGATSAPCFLQLMPPHALRPPRALRWASPPLGSPPCCHLPSLKPGSGAATGLRQALCFPLCSVLECLSAPACLTWLQPPPGQSLHSSWSLMSPWAWHRIRAQETFVDGTDAGIRAESGVWGHQSSLLEEV